MDWEGVEGDKRKTDEEGRSRGQKRTVPNGEMESKQRRRKKWRSRARKRLDK